MEKRLVYPQYNVKGDRDVFSVTDDKRWLTKTAGNYHPEIQAYIEKAKPMPDLIQVLLTALGAHEYWGQNVNGDRFYENALKNPGDDYGYKTFLSNANYFTHHVNKDPNLAKGKVLAATWNDAAKRVELVVGINPTLDPDAASMLDNGEALCFSMGARLPFDVCTVCGNKARTRAEYCEHLKYQMNQIDPQTGILVGAVNPTPKFFDISRVLIPADKTAYMWEKIAHAANSPLSKLGSAQLANMTIKQAMEHEPEMRKTASVSKSAEIKKQIIAISHPKAVEKLKGALEQVKQALDAGAVEIPKEVFSVGSNINQCIGTMAILGLVPTRSERSNLVDLFTGKDGCSQVCEVDANSINPTLIKRLEPYVAERSFLRPILLRRVMMLKTAAPTVGEGAAQLAKALGNVGKATFDGATHATSGVINTAKRIHVPKGLVGGTLSGGADLINAGLNITTGVMSAVGQLLGLGSGAVGKATAATTAGMPKGLAAVIAENPVIAGILAAIIFRPKSRHSSDPGLVSGNFSLANSQQDMYNNDWQRRFVQMQNRPVTVIKTGAAHEYSNMISPLTYLIMSVDLEKTAEQQGMWEMVADLFIKELQSSEFQNIVKSASSVLSGEDPENLSGMVPELADKEIIKHVLNFKN